MKPLFKKDFVFVRLNSELEKYQNRLRALRTAHEAAGHSVPKFSDPPESEVKPTPMASNMLGPLMEAYHETILEKESALETSARDLATFAHQCQNAKQEVRELKKKLENNTQLKVKVAIHSRRALRVTWIIVGRFLTLTWGNWDERSHEMKKSWKFQLDRETSWAPPWATFLTSQNVGKKLHINHVILRSVWVNSGPSSWNVQGFPRPSTGDFLPMSPCQLRKLTFDMIWANIKFIEHS